MSRSVLYVLMPASRRDTFVDTNTASMHSINFDKYACICARAGTGTRKEMNPLLQSDNYSWVASKLGRQRGARMFCFYFMTVFSTRTALFRMAFLIGSRNDLKVELF